MNKEEFFSGAAITALGAAIVGLMIWVAYLVNGSINQPAHHNPSYHNTYQVQPGKPVTKTRCDITGVMSSSIIAEEAANGYVFSGRVSTFLCGNNGLSFYLKQ